MLSFAQIILALALVAQVSVAQPQIFASARNIALTISADRVSPRNQQVTVKYRITNVGKAPLYVPRQETRLCYTEMHFVAWFVGPPHGVGGDCPGEGPSLSQRIADSAILLRPGEHADGTLIADPRFGNLTPGKHRIEAIVSGWREANFTEGERKELESIGNPLLEGDKSASIVVTLSR